MSATILMVKFLQFASLAMISTVEHSCEPVYMIDSFIIYK